MIQYDLKDLKLFVSIARLKSFRLAAERAFMTVSAASVRIRKLEDTFKTTLFIRHPREVELTEAGERFLKDAKAVLAQAESLEIHMERFSGREDNSVRLFSTYSAMTGRLKRDIGDFLLRYPESQIDFTLTRSKEILSALLEGTADIGVCGHDEKKVEGINFTPYFTCRFVLLTQRSTALEKHLPRHMSVKDLNGLPIVGLTKDTSMQVFLEENAREAGVRLNIRARFPSLHAGLDTLRTLEGVMFSPNHASVAREPDLVAIEIDEPWNKQMIQIAVPSEYRRIRPETRDLQTFLMLAANKEHN